MRARRPQRRGLGVIINPGEILLVDSVLISNCAQRKGVLHLGDGEVDSDASPSASLSPAALTGPVGKTSVQGGAGRWRRQRERLAKMPWYLTK